MRFIILCTVFTLLTAADATAQNRSFPYQARVAAEELFVRSGGGDSWLPTQRLTKDAVVTVHRHDPGGWYMIEPPEGSFSWIPERFVKRVSDTEGEIIENNVVAFVGSDFGEDTTVWQRRLTSGEKVTILNRRELVTLSGPQVMYQIKPPRREFRWIPGSGVIPIDEQQKRQQDSDPYATPSNAARPGAPQQPVVGGVTDVPAVRPGSELARLQQARADQVRLAAIDKQFREMILLEPGQWNLDAIEADYKRLQSESTYKPLAGQIDLRYPAIERYRRKLAEYQDFRRLTSQTEKREAELRARVNPRYAAPSLVAALPAGIPNTRPVADQPGLRPLPALPAGFGSPAVPTPDDISSQPAWGQPAWSQPAWSQPATETSVEVPQSEFEASLDDPPGLTLEPAAESGGWFINENQSPVPPESIDPLEIPGVSQTSHPPAVDSSEAEKSTAVLQAVFATEVAEPEFPAAATETPNDTPAATPRFVGAGILQRSPADDSGTAFVLATPTGRRLAHVQATAGVNLESYVGRQVGLLGQRSYRPDLQSDVIEVTGLEAVRIR